MTGEGGIKMSSGIFLKTYSFPSSGIWGKTVGEAAQFDDSLSEEFSGVYINLLAI